MGLSWKAFSECFEIPYRTVQNWYLGKRMVPAYLLILMTYYVKMEKHLKYGKGEEYMGEKHGGSVCNELKEKIKKLKMEQERLLNEAVEAKQWRSLAELKEYAGLALTEIAVIISDAGSSPRAEILNTSKSDIWIEITEEGFLEILTMHNRILEIYDEEIFDKETIDGSYGNSETERVLHGFLWLEIAA